MEQNKTLTDAEIVGIFTDHMHSLPSSDEQKAVAIRIGRAIESRVRAAPVADSAGGAQPTEAMIDAAPQEPDTRNTGKD